MARYDRSFSLSTKVRYCILLVERANHWTRGNDLDELKSECVEQIVKQTGSGCSTSNSHEKMMIPLPMTGDDSIPVVDPSGYHRQLWPRPGHRLLQQFNHVMITAVSHNHSDFIVCNFYLGTRNPPDLS